MINVPIIKEKKYKCFVRKKKKLSKSKQNLTNHQCPHVPIIENENKCFVSKNNNYEKQNKF